jgi:hypothetical protein
MGKIEDRMTKALVEANKLQPSAHGVEMQTKYAHHVPPAEPLSEVNESHLIFPHKYLNQYEKLKLRDPIAAEKFYNDCLYDPRPEPTNPYELEDKALAKLRQEVKPLRRRI